MTASVMEERPNIRSSEVDRMGADQILDALHTYTSKLKLESRLSSIDFNLIIIAENESRKSDQVL